MEPTRRAGSNQLLHLRFNWCTDTVLINVLFIWDRVWPWLVRYVISGVEKEGNRICKKSTTPPRRERERERAKQTPAPPQCVHPSGAKHAEYTAQLHCPLVWRIAAGHVFLFPCPTLPALELEPLPPFFFNLDDADDADVELFGTRFRLPRAFGERLQCSKEHGNSAVR